jgi:hypothetical protein
MARATSRTNNGLPPGDIEDSRGVGLLYSHPRQLLTHLGEAEATQVEPFDPG